MRVIEKSTGELIPYEQNPRRNEASVDAVAASIREFGFKVPIVIDANGVVVTGHTRLKAAKRLGLETVPCIIADDLTPEQIRAFRIADNKTGELSGWDFKLLDAELAEITDIDMGLFGFDMEEFGEDEDDGFYGDDRLRTDDRYHLPDIDHSNLEDDFWQMPKIGATDHVPERLIGFNYAKSSKDKRAGIHFYLDDYQFERIYSHPEKYTGILAEYDCMISPQFSLYLDMPMPMKIWNVYRARFIGAYYQSRGITVIPDVTWAEEATFQFCFVGLPKHSVIAINTMAVKRDREAMDIWKAGAAETIRRLEPRLVLNYGGRVDFDYGETPVKYYENELLIGFRERAGR